MEAEGGEELGQEQTEAHYTVEKNATREGLATGQVSVLANDIRDSTI